MIRLSRRQFLHLSVAAATGTWLAACVPIQAPEVMPEASPAPESPVRILFIGDSFSPFLADLFVPLCASATPPTPVEASVIWKGGWPLALHLTIPETMETLRTGEWDFVVVQEDLVDAWAQLDQFAPAVRQFHEEIQKIDAETILYMPWLWDYPGAPTLNQLVAAHTEVGKELGIKVAPAGLAWQRSLEERPDLLLYNDDKVHASPYGSYLATTVIYSTIFERSPLGSTFRMEGVNPFAYGWRISGDWRMADDDAEFLQRIAWNTVTDFATANE
jgi:hypothetical protein